jgi:glutamate N-acetyltransferase/amino-acid N-acetyltransferase
VTIKEIADGGVTSPQGFLATGVKAYIKKDKKDLAVIYSEVPAAAAGVFTTNKVKAAPLLVTKEHIKNGRARAVVVNAGNANACTGEQGFDNAVATAQRAGELLKIDPHDVIVTSTGVIGVQLPMDRVLAGVEKAVSKLGRDGGAKAAKAIMTTDTIPKEIAVEFIIGGKKTVIGAMAKGSGMIHPNMATMLGFVTTDTAVSPALLDRALRYAVNRTFNMVTVDGDTSTNDMVVVLANGLAGNPKITAEDEDYIAFRDALLYVCTYLARMIARDGEGATKLVEVRVVNAASEEDAKKAAKAVANSNLVKTAIFGEDANWGRIICAVGYSGAEFDPARVDISIGDEKMCQDGTPLNFSEERAKKILEQDEVTILVDMKNGTAEAVAWTCDFSYDYVKINADYRT